jgi:hypothetical protein
VKKIDGKNGPSGYQAAGGARARREGEVHGKRVHDSDADETALIKHAMVQKSISNGCFCLRKLM